MRWLRTRDRHARRVLTKPDFGLLALDSGQPGARVGGLVAPENDTKGAPTYPEALAHQRANHCPGTCGLRPVRHVRYSPVPPSPCGRGGRTHLRHVRSHTKINMWARWARWAQKAQQKPGPIR